VEFYVFGTDYQGFYNWFSWTHVSHIVYVYNDGIIGADKTDLGKN
jgi:hypothetical protein